MSAKALPTPLKLGGAFLAHLVAGWLGYYLTNAHHFVGLAWPTVGVGAAMLVWWGRGIWPALVASCLLLHLVIAGSFNTESLLFGLADLAEILVASLLLQWRCSWQSGFYSITQLQRVLLAGVVAPLVSAPLFTVALGTMPGDHASALSFLTSASLFWMRSAAGFFAIAPALLCWIHLPPKSILGPSTKEGVAVVLATLLLCSVVFTDWLIAPRHPFWLALVPMVVVFWSASRCGVFLTTHLIALVLAAASIVAIDRSDLFGDFTNGDARSMTWLILDLFGLCAMSLSVLSARIIDKIENEKAARERLQLMVRHSPIALIEFDTDFKVQVWNEQAVQLFGYQEQEALGKFGPNLLIPPSEHHLAHERWHSLLQGKALNGHFSIHSLTADGRTILCDWYGSLVRDEQQKICGVVCLVVNVSEREKANLALLESEQRLHNIADVLPQMIAYYDAGLVRRFSNNAYQEAFAGLESLEPAALQDLLPEDIYAVSLPLCQRALQGETVRFIEKIPLADGAEHSIDRILLPDYGTSETVVGFFSVATDITDYLEAQEQQLALETQILQTQKLESLGKLAGRLAHEFNNRLFGIIGHADIAMHDLSADHAGYQAMGRVLDIGREASDLCRQMFVFSGHGSGDKVPVELGMMVAEMRRLMELALPKRMRLTTNIAQQLAKVRADEAQVRQALMNLVTNATEASTNKRCDVHLEVQEVLRAEIDFTESFLVDDHPEKLLVAITVSDDGEGIAPDCLARIFDPFFTTRSGAKGLGLAGVIGIVHGHAGALLVQSEVGKGTRLSMYFAALPAVVDAPEHTSPGASA
jgi:PAS domain S-box-containing protein